MKKCKCGNSHPGPSGLCLDCIKISSKRFWEFIDLYKTARLKINEK